MKSLGTCKLNPYSRIHQKFLWPLVERRSSLKTGPASRFLAESDFWPAERIREFQWKRLSALVEHAYNHTVFFNKRMNEIGAKPDDIKSIEDFKKIPPVTREEVNENLYEMLADNIPEGERHFSSTGGSTGLATRFARDNQCLSLKKASEYKFNRWTGWNPGDKILYYWPALTDFSGDPQKLRFLRSLFYSRSLSLYAGRLNQSILKEHLSLFAKFRPKLVRAFPSALQRFCEYAGEHGIRLEGPEAIICVGEPLLQSQNKLFSEIFGCQVFNCYVSRECGNIACECPFHEGLHVAEELIYLEIERKGTGEYGEILLTDLWNMGMPFIRYRIQDAARWVDGECACGRKHRRIGIDAARLSDFLISPIDGSYVSGSTLTHYLLAEGPGVGRVKIIQDERDHIQVTMSGNKKSNREGADHIREKVSIIFQGTMRVDFNFVDSIPLLKSGKYSFVERKF